MPVSRGPWDNHDTEPRGAGNTEENAPGSQTEGTQNEADHQITPPTTTTNLEDLGGPPTQANPTPTDMIMDGASNYSRATDADGDLNIGTDNNSHWEISVDTNMSSSPTPPTQNADRTLNAEKLAQQPPSDLSHPGVNLRLDGETITKAMHKNRQSADVAEKQKTDTPTQQNSPEPENSPTILPPESSSEPQTTLSDILDTTLSHAQELANPRRGEKEKNSQSKTRAPNNPINQAEKKVTFQLAKNTVIKSPVDNRPKSTSVTSPSAGALPPLRRPNPSHAKPSPSALDLQPAVTASRNSRGGDKCTKSNPAKALLSGIKTNQSTPSRTEKRLQHQTVVTTPRLGSQKREFSPNSSEQEAKSDASRERDHPSHSNAYRQSRKEGFEKKRNSSPPALDTPPRRTSSRVRFTATGPRVEYSSGSKVQKTCGADVDTHRAVSREREKRNRRGSGSRKRHEENSSKQEPRKAAKKHQSESDPPEETTSD